MPNHCLNRPEFNPSLLAAPVEASITLPNESGIPTGNIVEDGSDDLRMAATLQYFNGMLQPEEPTSRPPRGTPATKSLGESSSEQCDTLWLTQCQTLAMSSPMDDFFQVTSLDDIKKSVDTGGDTGHSYHLRLYSSCRPYTYVGPT
ncbi:hypothetical protein BJ912DRAFT_1056165 [Pholiota molesta]|nr:hypothetical protein BJ912DRAFT_1056165 [Pholiota molesta]